MNNPIDKLFNQKLSEQTIDPGAGAWARIEKGLSKKNKTIIWFRAAAALFLVALSGVLWYVATSGNSSTLTNEAKISEVQSQEPETIQVPQQKEQKESLPLPPKQNITRTQRPKASIQKKEVQKKNENQPEEIGTEMTRLIEIQVAELVTPPLEMPKEDTGNVSTASKPIVIVYELKAINQRTSNDDEFLEVPERKSALRKVLTLANDVRSGESKIGGLRQAKEEILAFNFKKEDKNNNNR